MAEYIITRASIINRCNYDGRLHLQFTEAERPCREAYLKELRDENGILCSRYCVLPVSRRSIVLAASMMQM